MTRDELFTQIAKDNLNVETLAIRNSDELDFHECSVWGIKAALQAAYLAGRNDTKTLKAAKKNPADGTCYRGSIEASYHDVVALLGAPLPGDGCKTEASWVIQRPRKPVVTIYNYKNSRAYSPDFPKIEDVTEWHIGGHDRSALDAALTLLGDKAKLVERI